MVPASVKVMSYHGNRYLAKCGMHGWGGRLTLANSSAIGLVLGNSAACPDDEIVAVDHFRASADPKDDHDIRRGAAPDFFGVLGVVGDETPTDLMSIGPTHHDGVAARE